MFSCKLLLSKNELNFRINFSIVNEKICTSTVLFFLPLKIILECWCHSTKTLSLNTVNAEKTDQWVIKLKPLIFLSFYKRDVMSWLCISNMHDYTSKFIIIFAYILWLFLWRLLSVKVLQTVWVNIEFHGKLMFTGDFFIYKSVQIENDSLKMDN